MATGAADGAEDALAAADLGVAGSALRRDSEHAAVERDALQLVSVELGVAAGDEPQRRQLRRRQGLARKERRGDAEVLLKGVGHLLFDRGLVRLPAEAAQLELAALVIDDVVGPPGDPVAVGVVGIGA